MQKVFCDLCNKEIEKSNPVSGAVMRVVPVISISSKIKSSSDSYKREILDLCNECCEWLWNLLEKEKENKKYANSKTNL